MANIFPRRLLSSEAYAKSSRPLERRLRRISPLERKEEARSFLELFYSETGGLQSEFSRRWSDVRRQLNKRGSYEHTPEELAFGARVAWRNHGRCVGRLFWQSLEVFDCRDVTDPDAMVDHIIRHMTTALGDGRIRSLITIFPPIKDRRLPAYVESAQITQYAGHVSSAGHVLGDRQNVDATQVARSLGWKVPESPSRFDMLPIFLRDEKDRRCMYILPADSYREIPITHPHYQGIDELGLRWYAVPCVSGMILTIGGIDYPCAPFNGFYMATEIASRNFADRKRYDLMSDVGRAIGFDTGPSSSPLWRDTVLTELNRAVMHSYHGAGVTMIDHHSASEQFMEFHGREQANGRRVAADWRWIVPPQAAAACEVFHLRMRNFHAVPNFYRDRGTDGLQLMPWYGDKERSRQAVWLDRITRRWKIWKRMPW